MLTGAGAAFCAGFDQGPTPTASAASDPAGKPIAEYIEYWQRHDGERPAQWEHMWRLGKPIIAAVNGWAMGAGFWYQLAADITIASDKAVFAQPEVRHISNSSYLFRRLCGWKAANRWALTGDHFDAQEALRIGMVNEVVPHERTDGARARARAADRAGAGAGGPAQQGDHHAWACRRPASMPACCWKGRSGALAHASHNEYREQLLEAQRQGGLKAYLEMRDGPFQPEPMGPRSAKGRQKKAGK